MDIDLAQYPVVVFQNVTWGDMDANGHVNNVEYFRYMENARVEFYRRIGKFEFERETGITLFLKSTTCNFLGPLAYPDRIAVGARMQEMTDDQMIMAYAVVNQGNQKPSAVGEATIIAFNVKTGTRVPLPGELQSRIRNLHAVHPVITEGERF